MRSLQTQFLDKTIAYSGKELRSLWIYEQTQIIGDAIVSFVGPTDVPTDNMADAEDVTNQAPIWSPKMLHFIGEFFVEELEIGVLYQHLWVALVCEKLNDRKIAYRRRGNDIYVQERKLSVSIATRSPSSLLLHMGINIETEGTPVPTAGLAELSIEPIEFANEFLEGIQTEFRGWQKARCKVYPALGN